RALNFTAPAGASSTFRAPRRFEIHPVRTLQEVRDRFARDQGLPFAASLSQDSILDALNQHGVLFRDRIFSPVTTIWGFLPQVLSDDHNRAEQFKVATTILDASIDDGQIGSVYERRWDGEVDIRSIKSTMKMDILRCKTPGMVEKEIWVFLL